VEIWGRTHHLLVSLWGSKWRTVKVAYFSAFLDDSGTDPNQRVAIGTALVVPAARIPALDKEWGVLQRRHGFTDFHTSEFVARNPKSDFVNWSKDKQQVVFRRVRQITKKYGVRIYSFAVNKSDYDEVIPVDLRRHIGGHYAWAIRHLLSHLVAWRVSRRVAHPLQYLFDWEQPSSPTRREIDKIMEQAERQAAKMEPPLTGEYLQYDFRPRKDHPGLQCVDSLAWMFYQVSLAAFCGTPCNPFATVAWDDFGTTLKGDVAGLDEWITAMSITRDDLKRWMDDEAKTHKTRDVFAEFEEQLEGNSGKNQSRIRKVRRDNAQANRSATR
jgi:hypothetical protein